MKSGNADVYKNEIPGGQYTNLQVSEKKWFMNDRLCFFLICFSV